MNRVASKANGSLICEYTFFTFTQSQHAASPMLVTLSGIVMEVRPEQSRKAAFPIHVKLAESVNEPRAEHHTNAKSLLVKPDFGFLYIQKGLKFRCVLHSRVY